MPHDYDAKLRVFVKRDTGKQVSRARVRGLIDDLTERVQRDAKNLAVKFESGSINLAEFEIGMRELLKSGHIIASSIGRGGLERMTLSDWGRVGSKIKWQYQYLARFARKIEQGRISKVLTANRAQLYASSLHISFYNSVSKEGQKGPEDDRPKVRRILNAQESCPDCEHYAGLGWIDADEMPELGELQCGDYCKCDLEFQDDVAQ
jgi:hypothetical protein